jgi:hypothetical protein
LEPIAAGGHLGELFFSRNRSGEANDRICRRDAAPHGQGKPRRLVWIEQHRPPDVIRVGERSIEELPADALTAIRWLDEKLADVPLFFRGMHHRDSDDFTVVARRPNRPAIGEFRGDAKAGIIVFAAPCDCAKVIRQRDRDGELSHAPAASPAAHRPRGGDG